MRWITRVFVSAAVRRIAAVCVLVLLGWLGIGTARAQSCGYLVPCATEAEAYAFVYAEQSRLMSIGCAGISAERTKRGPITKSGRRYQGDVLWVANDGPICSASALWSASGDCSARPDKVGKPWQSSATDVREGSVSCEDGCEAVWSPNGDGTATGFFGVTGNACIWPLEDCSKHPGTYWNPVVMSCEYPEPETCPAGQQKNAAGNCVDNQCPAGMVEGPAGTCINEKNECPAGEVKSPTGQCLPGEGRCAQGEARGKDGTCKRDSDGDGVPDNEDDNPDNDDPNESFSGGDDCNSPPACNGSPIACGQARIQWRIECNTRRNVTITGGACTSMPICAGKECNAMEYSQLLQQWKAACALDKLANRSPGEGGSGDNSDLIGYLSSGGTVNTDAMGNGGIEVGDPWGDGTGSPGDDFQPDGSGFGYSSSCPTFPVVNVMGTSLDFNNGPLCDWLALGGQLVLILAALASLRIVAGSAA